MFTFEATKTTPFAPPELEGEYKLTIKGRHMKMTKVDGGIKARATCNKTDDWNLADGINTCLGRIQAKKANDVIKVGDRVKIVDNGKQYTSYADWVANNIKSRADVARFCYGCDIPNGTVGTVVCIAPHGVIGETLAYVKTMNEEFGYCCYLMNVKGLKKI